MDNRPAPGSWPKFLQDDLEDGEAHGNEIAVTDCDQGVRFLLVSGKPIGEPVAWRGAIVMNTQEELRLAFEEYNAGTFIK